MLSRCLLSALLALSWSGAAAAERYAFRGAQVLPVSGPPITDGLVVTEGERITWVGPWDPARVPEGARLFEGAVVTPGLVDALTTAGLTGPHNQPFDQDHAEGDSPVRPELRAADAFDPHDPLLDWLGGLGITVLHVSPSPGQPVSGRTAVLANRRGLETRDGAAPGALLFTLGDAAGQRFGQAGSAGRMGNVATIREALVAAQDHAARQRLPLADRPPRDLGLEALGEALRGERRVVVHAHEAADIAAALELGREFGLDWILAGGAEAWLVAEELAAAEVPVILGPVMARSWRPGEQRNSSFAAAGILSDAGVPVAFMSGYEGYVPKVRVVLWEAAVAGANGLGPERTLRSLTLEAAEILGIDAEVGSLEVGKQAHVALWDGDPLETTTHACAVLSAGELLSETCR